MRNRRTALSGAVLPGATVEARSSAGVFTAVTNSSGVYRFPALDPGRYEVTAELEGFGQARSAPVDVLVGQMMKVDLALSIAGVTESVVVTSDWKSRPFGTGSISSDLMLVAAAALVVGARAGCAICHVTLPTTF